MIPPRPARAGNMLCAAIAAGLMAGVPTMRAGAQQSTDDTGPAWSIVRPPQSSQVFARDGSLIGEIGTQLRTSVALRTLPKYVGEAFIAVEDKRFYEHNGVDPLGVLAAIKDAAEGHVRGASTITQLLVGNMHPDKIDRHDRSIGRKLHEQEAALEMERHYSKAEILQAFLNQLDFGHHWFGIEDAARHYFGVPASKLTLPEAASLASMPKSPTEYDPIRHPKRNRERRNLVLALMADQGYITHAQATAAQATPVVTAPDAGMAAPAGYFVDEVRRVAEHAGVPVEKGGYRIYTTLDPELQRDAVDAVRDGTARAEATPGFGHITMAKALQAHRSDYLEAALVAIDPHTGDVRALVGGRSHTYAPFDRATDALRQPGSAIKPVLYATALADSMPANAIVPDTAISIALPEGGTYTPHDDDGLYLGPMTIRQALIESRNSVAVQVGQMVTIDSVAQLAQQLGIETPMARVPSSAIGASAVHPIDLVAAYTAFANQGGVVQPRLVRRIEDPNGRMVYSEPPSTPRQVIDPRVAFIVRDMMKDVAERGTGRQARLAVPASIPIAGKTGTTDENTDLWFLGMTPGLVAGVWVGFDRPTSITEHAFGGSLAAPIWGEMIRRYYANRPKVQWGPAPGGLVFGELDRDTGALATPETPPDERYTEFFLPGTEPPPLRNNPWRVPQWGPLVAY